MEYRAKVCRAPHGFDAWTPDIPGCAANGTTEAEALQNLRHAIEGRLDLDRFSPDASVGAVDRVVAAEPPEIRLRRAAEVASTPPASASPFPSFLSFIVGGSLLAVGLTGIFGFILIEPHTTPAVFFGSAILAGLGGGGVLMGLLTRESTIKTAR